MLILKEPVKLHIADCSSLSDDTFSEKLLGNYSLIGAHYAPKDLLLLMTASPEIPEDLGGMTTLAIQNNVSDTRNISMSILNNVVNRILLDGSANFTYQDQVYITSVLNQLGITQIDQFMEQVRSMRTQQETVNHLANLYEQQLQVMITRMATGENTPNLPFSSSQAATQDSPKSEEPTQAMSLEVFNRLQTGDIYKIIYAFRNNYGFHQSVFSPHTLQLSEHLRLSSQLKLQESKQHVYGNQPASLLHQTNNYETGLLLPPPTNEEQVLQQATVAALFQTIGNTISQTIQRNFTHSQQWLYLDEAIWQSAETAISRFESYHTYPTQKIQQLTQSVNVNQTLQQEVSDFQKLFYYLNPSIAPVEEEQLQSVASSQPEEVPVKVPKRRGRPPRAKTTAETNNASLVVEPEKKEDNLSTPVVPKNTPEALAATSQKILREQLKQIEQHNRTLIENIQSNLIQQRQNVIVPSQLPAAITQVLQSIELPEPTRQALINQVQSLSLTHPVISPELEDALLQSGPQGQAIYQTLVNQTQQLNTAAEYQRRLDELTTQDPKTFATAKFGPQGELLTPTEISTPPSPPTPVNQVFLDATQAEEIAPDILMQQVQQIDMQNRTIMENLQAYAKDPTIPPLPLPDIKRTMADTLRAMEDPQGMLNHLVANEPTPTMSHPVVTTPEEEAFLAQFDPATREMYKTLLLYQTNPTEAKARGLRSSNIGELNSAAVAITHPEKPLEPEEFTTNIVAPVVMSVLESQAPELIKARTIKPPPLPSPAPNVQIIHKAAPPDITQELLERLETTKTTSKVENEQIDLLQQHQTTTTDFNQIENKIVTQTTEDITALINRTLSRQMRTISDQVYQQMEKKLQIERTRRGRF